jgi:N-acetylneuraminic acid mutarotase
MFSLNMRTFTWSIQKVRGDIVKPRDEHTAVVDEENSLMIIFGGFEDGERVNSTMIYNMKTNVWQVIKIVHKAVRPCPRSGHSASYADGVMYVFGGKDCDSNKLNDIWSFNLKGGFWSKLSPVGNVNPCVRSGHSSCMYEGYLVIFGGILEVTKELNDLYAYSIQQNRWIVLQEDVYGSPV